MQEIPFAVDTQVEERLADDCIAGPLLHDVVKFIDQGDDALVIGIEKFVSRG